MHSAILFLFFPSLGVMFGWQPMPDGSPRYEVLVQLEPELLATMQQGQTIPIASEVPEEIRPIGRVRIVVGEEELPRKQVVTNFKPWPGQESPSGIVETQYTVQPVGQGTGSRYGNQPILPADRATQPILPPGKQPGQQSRTQTTPGAILPRNQPISPPANGRDRFVEPIQNSTQTFGNQLRSSGQAVRADAEQLFGDSSDSILPKTSERANDRNRPNERSILTNEAPIRPSARGGAPITPGTGAILPPRSNSRATNSNLRESRSSNTIEPRYPRSDLPITTSEVGNWNQAKNASTTTTNRSGEFNAPWPPLERFSDSPLAQEWDTQNKQPSTNNSAPDWASRSQDREPVGVASRPTGPAFTERESSPSERTSSTQADRYSDGSDSNPNWPQSSLATPEIRREMLAQPATADLQTAGGNPVPQNNSTVIQSPTMANPPVAPANSTGGMVFPLILAWVLLSGSGAGNLYLLWSYMDVRNKYRGIIRSVGRKAIRRYGEDSRYDDSEYDD